MSTRSGKRIHTSLLEDTAPTEPEPAVKSERKTRSKRVKENLDELSVSLFKNKKRNNYVSYPTDDELLGDTATKEEDETKPNRVLRKNALKEQQNLVENIDQLEPQTEAKSIIRKSRRGKRVDDAEETENHENVPAEVTALPKSKKSKKKKVNKIIDNPPPSEDLPPPSEDVPANKSKKKKKKGKKRSSTIVEDVPQNDNSKNGTFNRSNMSIESFHSAAGSPYKKCENVDMIPVKKLSDTVETLEPEGTHKRPSKTNKKRSNKTFDINYLTVNMSVDQVDERKNNTFDKGTKRSQPLSNGTTLDQCFVSVARNNIEKDLENILNVSNLSNAQIKRRKSNTRDATFDKSNDSTNVGVESNLNVSNASNRQIKKRKSSNKEVNEVSLPENMSEEVNDNLNNDTFDKGLRRRNSVVKDVTFDKSNASLTKEIVDQDVDLNVSNISNKHLNSRRSILKDSTFDKSSASMTNEDPKVLEIDLNVSNKHPRARKPILRDSTFDKSNASIANGNFLDRDTETDLNVSNNSHKQLRRRKSSVKDTTFDKQDTLLNTTFEKNMDNINKTKKDSTFDKINNKYLDATYEKDIESDSTDTSTAQKKENKPSVDTTYDKTDKAIDTTFEKDMSTSFNAFKKGAMNRKSSIKDATFEKSDTSVVTLTKEDFEKDNNIISSSATKRRSIRRHTFDKIDTIPDVANTTFEKISDTETELKRKSLRISKSEDIQAKLNTTFEIEENLISNSKSSLISSDNSCADKSNISRISITSDDTSEHFENIVNTTPLLIESSMDESHVLVKPESPKPHSPLKREGTFTKDGVEDQRENELETPTKRRSLSVPTAGCTPYHITKSSQKKTVLNLTRSIEKGVCASVDPAPRMTRVMFCSPVDNPVVVAQERRKIIKSNLKGSNKSFVFDESASISRPGRKRSYTQSDADDARVKRTRLTEDLQQSVDRLSRPRTASATGKLAVSPKKPSTPSKPRSEGKRTKLPNFAALHQKQFAKMESLGECQERRAKRARQLLTPTAPPGLLDRISPKNNLELPKGKDQTKTKDKTDTPTKKLPTLESLRPGFTRFGFKLNLDVNPFSIPSKTEKPKEKPIERPNGIPPRPAILPSTAGATSIRREVAKLTVMREKSFTERRNVKRNQNRTIIKGVRTNRRFELQMKLRNID